MIKVCNGEYFLPGTEETSDSLIPNTKAGLKCEINWFKICAHVSMSTLDWLLSANRALIGAWQRPVPKRGRTSWSAVNWRETLK